MDSFIPTYLLFLTTVASLALCYFLVRERSEERKMIDEERKVMHATWVQERKDLYDRIQSTSFVEYKDHVPEPEAKVEEPTEIPLEDARDELMGDEDGNI